MDSTAMTKRLLVAATTLTLLLLVHTSCAAPDSRVWLVGSDQAGSAQQVETELVSVGFAVVFVSSFDPDQPLDDEVVAVVDLAPDGSRAELWVAVGAEHRALHRGTVLAPSGEMTLPLRVAEDLRALTQHRLQPRAPSAPQCPEPRCPTCSERPCRCPTTQPCPCSDQPPVSRASWRGGLDTAVLMPSGGVGAGGQAIVRLEREFAGRLSAGALFAWPTVSAEVRNDGGSSTVSPILFGAQARVFLLRPAEARWNAGATVGVALQWLRMDGYADPPWVGQRDEVWSSVSFFGVESLLALSNEASVRGALAVGTSAPPVTIRFAGEPKAEWGAPMAWASLGIEMGLF